MSQNKFYVYEHWRPDLDVCFYVGKGHGQRAYNFKRKHNIRHQNIVKKLIRLGMCAEVRLVGAGLSEPDAFKLEIERIAFWRGVGVSIVNKTDGGGGASGFKHTDEFKAMARMVFMEANKNRGPISEETRAKQRLAKLGKNLTPEHIEKVRLSSIGRKYGPMPEERKLRIAATKRGKKASPETCEKKRLAMIGKNKRPRTDEEKAVLSAALKGKPWSEARRAAQKLKEIL